MGKQICVGTDIKDTRLHLDSDHLSEVIGLNLQAFNVSSVFQISSDRLELLKMEVERVVDELFLNRNSTLPSRNSWEHVTEAPVDDKYFERSKLLNLRDSYDWHLAVLLSFWELIVTAISYQGALYIFDRDPLAKYLGASIIAFLRNNKANSKDAIRIGLINLFEKYNINETIDEVTLNMGLENLKKHGLISYSRDDNEYVLTARGIMFS